MKGNIYSYFGGGRHLIGDFGDISKIKSQTQQINFVCYLQFSNNSNRWPLPITTNAFI